MIMTYSKTHTKTGGFNPYSLCGLFVGIGFKSGVTSIAAKVTCGNCKRSKKFKPGRNSKPKCVLACGGDATHVHRENIVPVKYCRWHKCDTCVLIKEAV